MTAKPTTAEPQKPHRRWFQFRLRTLLIGVGLAAVVCYSALFIIYRIESGWVHSPIPRNARSEPK